MLIYSFSRSRTKWWPTTQFSPTTGGCRGTRCAADINGQCPNELRASAVYGVQRELKHYGCMADLLGRVGLIKEAMEMIEGMPMKVDVFVWGGLLGGCRLIHGNVEVAEIAAQRLMELDPEDGGVYTVMANIYATERRWEDVAKMRKLMNGRKIKHESLLQLNSNKCNGSLVRNMFFLLLVIKLEKMMSSDIQSSKLEKVLSYSDTIKSILEDDSSCDMVPLPIVKD
ncbi:hypothetical protein IFM89_037384 [Coptis chinensis]|uniref:Pentatricopeptide repeat-containing protein n=1 Tax=Coptis chinensis TaxID=261450 RepID=A0A835M5W4_9MAGN|nr:hypothetical protein IFM89_037384 [Coptis chinensis]